MMDTVGAREDIQLTLTERQVLGYVMRGYVNSEIAEALNIATSTVKSCLHATFIKLRARNRAQAVILALTQKYLNLDEVFSPQEIAHLWSSLDQGTIDRVVELVKQGRQEDPILPDTQ